MSNELCQSKTKENLMRAFAGEALSCSRYKIAEKVCRQKQLFVLANLFKFTAAQEKIHGEVFYDHLKQCGCESVSISADYPTECSEEPARLLRHSLDHERKEQQEVYPAFAKTARDEGFPDIARDFENIASIEGAHGDRYERFAELLEQNRLFCSDKQEDWLCLNCGYIGCSTQAPETCPVCKQPQGWFIRLAETPWELCRQGEDKC
ncbi:MAG: rubrerythrin family protein [Ruminococcus sp.]|nr:rubrerythrin family protein [Ruminococcus sp.]